MNIKLLNEFAQIPTRGSEYAAGYDLYAAIKDDIVIAPHTTEKIDIGIAIELPDNTFGAIFPRSGLATKEGLRLANCTAVIDPDYRGPIIVALHNDSAIHRIIKPNERIAQLVVIPFETVTFEVVDNLNTTSRGDGGFGSTGI